MTIFIKGILTLLFSVIAIAQTTDSVDNGVIYGSYELGYDVGKLKNYAPNAIVRRTQNVTATEYGVWGIGSVSDSLLGTAVAFPDSLVEDTSYVYGITLALSNGKWYESSTENWLKPIITPNALDLLPAGDYELILGWTKGTRRDWGVAEIERRFDHVDSSYSVIDTIPITLTSYTDTGLTFDTSYCYRLRYLINNYSGYSNEICGVVTQPDRSFTVEPASITFGTIDSVAQIESTDTEDDILLNAESNDLTGWSLVNLGSGNTLTTTTGASNHGTYGYHFLWNGTTANIRYKTAAFAANNEVYIRARVFISTGYAQTAFQLNEMFSIQNAGSDIVLEVNIGSEAGGEFSRWRIEGVGITNAYTSDSVVVNRWFTLEMYFKGGGSTGSDGAEVRVNGVAIFSDLVQTIAGAPTKFFIGNNFAAVPTAASYIDVDDLFIGHTDWIGEFPMVADKDTLTFDLINNSGGDISLISVSGEALPIIITVDETLPFTVVDTDTVTVTVAVKKDTTASVNQILTVDTDFVDTDVSVQVEIVGATASTWDYESDFSVNVDGWNADGSVLTANVDGVMDGIGKSLDNVLMIVSDGTTNDYLAVGINHPTKHGQVAGDRYQISYTYLLPVSVPTPIRFSGAGGGYELLEGVREGYISYVWATNYFDVIWNDDFSRGISAYWDGAITTDTIWIADIKWRKVIESDTTAPDPPTSFLATGFNTGGSTYNRLTWVESISADKDTLHLWATAIDDIDGAYTELIALLTGTVEYDDTIVVAGSERRYYITQEDNDGNVSVASNIDSAFTPTQSFEPPPAIPNPHIATGGLFELLLEWDDNSDNEDGFNVYVGGQLFYVAAAADTSYTLTGLPHNTSYSTYITSFNAAGGESQPTNTENTSTTDTTTFSGNEYFVEKGSGGNGSGTSFANAWRSFGAINWSLLGAGDILWIGGGTDSLIYYETLVIGASGSASAQLLIRNSTHAGHNGRVIIDGSNNTRDRGIKIDYFNYITLYGLEIRRSLRGVYIHYAADTIIMDSLNIYDCYGQAGIKTEGSSLTSIINITIRNCTFNTFANACSQVDNIYIQRTTNIVIHDNFIRQSNTCTSNSHSDNIQFYLVVGAKIYNNVIICDENVLGIAMILGTQSTGSADTLFVYNNFVFKGGIPTKSPIVWVQACLNRWYGIDNQPVSLFYNNTFVTTGSYTAPFQSEMNVTKLENNIIAMYGTGVVGSNNWSATVASGYSIAVTDAENNLWYRQAGSPKWGGIWTGNSNQASWFQSWTTWTNTLTGNGVNANPLFADAVADGINLTNGVLQSGSPAKNAGKDLQSIIEGMGFEWKDILGNVRDSTPTIGAYE